MAYTLTMTEPPYFSEYLRSDDPMAVASAIADSYSEYGRRVHANEFESLESAIKNGDDFRPMALALGYRVTKAD